MTYKFVLQILTALLVLPCCCADNLYGDSFGSGANQFDIDLVSIGNPNNVADTTGDPGVAGSVGYSYRIGQFEVTRDMVNKANAVDASLGIIMADMSGLGGNGANRPATGITWYEAAKFCNFLNASSGFQAAYKFEGGVFKLWELGDVGYDSNNAFRNSGAKYYLPDTNEWYKAAYFNPVTNSYSNFATGSNIDPLAITSGTGANSVVYNQLNTTGPADFNQAGGLSFYGTMAQSGNVWEWDETESDLVNDSVTAIRGYRGGGWLNGPNSLKRTFRNFNDPTVRDGLLGFRIAAIPEPSSFIVLGFCSGLAVVRRRRK